MLRTRFTVAVAVAVAAVTLAITAVAFLVLRSDLQNQARQVLAEQSAAVYRLARHYDGHIPAGWVPPHSERFGVSTPYSQLITAQGDVWTPPATPGRWRRGTRSRSPPGSAAPTTARPPWTGCTRWCSPCGWRPAWPCSRPCR